MEGRLAEQLKDPCMHDGSLSMPSIGLSTTDFVPACLPIARTEPACMSARSLFSRMRDHVNNGNASIVGVSTLLSEENAIVMRAHVGAIVHTQMTTWIEEVQHQLGGVMRLPTYDRTIIGERFVGSATKAVVQIMTDLAMGNAPSGTIEQAQAQLTTLLDVYMQHGREHATLHLRDDIESIKVLNSIAVSGMDTDDDNGPEQVASIMIDGVDSLHRVLTDTPIELRVLEERNHTSFEMLRYAVIHGSSVDLQWEDKMRLIRRWALIYGRSSSEACCSALIQLRMQLSSVIHSDMSIVEAPSVVREIGMPSHAVVRFPLPYHLSPSSVRRLAISSTVKDISSLRWVTGAEILIKVFRDIVASGSVPSATVKVEIVEPTFHLLDSFNSDLPSEVAVTPGLETPVVGVPLSGFNVEAISADNKTDALILKATVQILEQSMDSKGLLKVLACEVSKRVCERCSITNESRKCEFERYMRCHVPVIMRRLHAYTDGIATMSSECQIEVVGYRNSTVLGTVPGKRKQKITGKAKRGSGLIVNSGGARTLSTAITELLKLMRNNDATLCTTWHNIRTRGSDKKHVETTDEVGLKKGIAKQAVRRAKRAYNILNHGTPS